MNINEDKYQVMTYYKLPENYHYFEEDVTKFDSLTGDEIDGNFFVLEGRDIDSIEISEDKKRLILNLINGGAIESDNIFTEYIETISMEYDPEDGVLSMFINGCTQEPITADGFITLGDIKELLKDYSINTDTTLTGDGTKEHPLSVASSLMPGTVKPINGVIEGELPEEATIGDRYLTFEEINLTGKFYNFNGLGEVMAALKEEDNGWRVATKPEWDSMLNALEPKPLFRNHDSHTPSKWLGKKANLYLKQSTPFGLEYCGYVFNGDEKVVSFNTTRASFWTASNFTGKPLTENDNEAWVKQFYIDKGQVYQTIVDNAIYSSIRLVKECDGTEKENAAEILGTIYPVDTMRSATGKTKMWTTVNLDYDTENSNCFTPDSSLVTKPYINEWNGMEWVKYSLDDYVTFMNKETEEMCYVKNGEIVKLDNEISDTINTLQEKVTNLEDEVIVLSDLINKYHKTPTEKLNEAIEYEYADYQYKGVFTIIDENQVGYSISASDLGDGTNMMNDFARLFGAMYRTNKIEPIQFNYTYYDWDDNSTLKGSNYKKVGEPLNGQVNTLVHAFVGAYSPSVSTYYVKFDSTVVSVVISIE